MTRLRQVTVSSRTHIARIEECQVEQPKFDHTAAADSAAADKAAEKPPLCLFVCFHIKLIAEKNAMNNNNNNKIFNSRG